jgi:hypothetical protein
VTKFGYGRHANDLPAHIRYSSTPLMVSSIPAVSCSPAHILQLFWLGQILFKLSTLFAKLSLFFIYRDLFAQVDSLIIRITSISNYVTAFVVVTYYTAATLVSIFSCTPVSKAWHPKDHGSCIDSLAFLYSTAACNIITSLLLISTPIPLLLRTKHRRTETSQLLFLVLLGLA